MEGRAKRETTDNNRSAGFEYAARARGDARPARGLSRAGYPLCVVSLNLPSSHLSPYQHSTKSCQLTSHSRSIPSLVSSLFELLNLLLYSYTHSFIFSLLLSIPILLLYLPCWVATYAFPKYSRYSVTHSHSHLFVMVHIYLAIGTKQNANRHHKSLTFGYL